LRNPDLRSTATDCLSRGVRNLRANPWFVLAAVLQQAVTAGLTVAGFVPILRALGYGWRPPSEHPSLGRLLDPETVAAALAELLLAWPDLVGALLVALVPALLSWTLALACFCGMQGGIYGLLYAADRQAGRLPVGGVTGRALGAGEADALPGWRAFRLAWSWRSFAREGGRLLMPCFNLLHLYTFVVLLALLAWSLLLAALSRGLGPGGELTAAAFGCAALAVVVAPFAALAAVSFFLAQADLPRRGATVRGAAARSLAVLRRRPADVAVLAATWLAASLAVAGAAAPLSSLARGSAAATAALLAVELAAAVALTTLFAAATVALMRDAAEVAA